MRPIHENRFNINNLIDSITFLNETSVNIHENIETHFVTRRFLLAHGEVQIYNQVLKVSLDELNNNIKHLELYLNVLIMGILNLAIIDPIQLQIKLANIQKELTPTLML